MLMLLMKRSALIVAIGLLSLSADAVADNLTKFNLPAGELIAALKSLANQADVELVYSPEQLKGMHTAGVRGTYSPHDAISLLLKGTPLQVHTDASGAMVISPVDPIPPANKTPASSKTLQNPTGEPNGAPRSRLQLAQADQTAPATQTVAAGAEQSTKKSADLEEVVVTGSRIPRTANAGIQEVKIYSQQRIEQSGQTTIADFLNTLPDVSVSTTENTPILGTVPGPTTVQLHGLPIGTTLVLINGRRVEVSGSQGSNGSNFFDLNNIPVSAIERVEVLSEGSSAVYGSDAIAGVINVILRKDFTGVDANLKYGWASGTHESDVSTAWGQQWDRGAVSIVASYQARSELIGFQRGITSSDDKTHFGGEDHRLGVCNPGNIVFPNGYSFNGEPPVSVAAVPAGFTGPPSIQEFASTAGTTNKCNIGGYADLIPSSRRAGVFAAGNFALTSSVEIFSEFMYSYVQQNNEGTPPFAFAVPGFTQFTASASNPYNPFKQPVGVSYSFTDVGRQGIPVDTAFVRPLLGLRGSLLGSWRWEVASWEAQDRSKFTQVNSLEPDAVQAALNSSDPNTALNLFTAGPPGSPALLHSLLLDRKQDFLGQTVAASAFVQGPAFRLPAGTADLVIGTEYDRDKLYFDQFNVIGVAPNTHATYARDQYAFFGETRVPILGSSSPHSGEELAATLASRYDHYQNSGSKSTPQFGIEWRPWSSLLLRGSYARSFKAPGLFNLFQPETTFQSIVVDPKRGGQFEGISAITGGNPSLHPETGESKTFGLLYASQVVSDFRLSVTHWQVKENNSIQQIDLQTLANNADLFPANVTRAPSQSGQLGPIVQINSTFVNFGEIDVKGIDLRGNYVVSTDWGQITPSLSATDTYRYTAGLIPGSPPSNRLSRANIDGNWAPRWKATAALGWNHGPYSLNFDGRYVGRYQDYDSPRTIGNFWLIDAQFSYAIGEGLAQNASWLRKCRVVLGGVNVFNTLPQFSNFDFGSFGYDPAQADIRGRFLYAQFQAKF